MITYSDEGADQVCMMLRLVPSVTPDPSEPTLPNVRAVLDRAVAGQLSVLDHLDDEGMARHEFVHAAWDYADATGRELIWVDLGGIEGSGAGVATAYGSPQKGFRHMSDSDPDYGDLWDFDPLAPPLELNEFGTPSLPLLASSLAEVNASPDAIVVLEGADCTRPYARMLTRLTTLPAGGRDAVRDTVCSWLADDLATFARQRPNGPTLVVTEPGDAARTRLHARAAVVLPMPSC